MNTNRDNPNQELPESLVPQAVISRLSLYLRELQRLVREGQETTSSTQLGSLFGFTDARVRKDLAYFGQFGYPGIGYRVEELITAIKGILGTDQSWEVIIVGIGNLGRALLGYKGFENQGFRIVGAFDSDPAKTDTQIDGVPVYAIEHLADFVISRKIRLAIIAVPAMAAQKVADQLVEAGIDGVVNFAPVTIFLPKSIQLIGVDLAIELEQLSFAVVNQRENP